VLTLMVLAGYVLVYFGLPGGARFILDRDSRFHSVANLPLSILTALALVELPLLAGGRWPRAAILALGAGYLALILAFSISHQDDFAREAERQKLAMAQLIVDHPMMDRQATFILEEPDLGDRDLPAIEYRDGHSFYSLMMDLFDFSNGVGGRVGPAIRIVAGEDWREELTLGENGEVKWPTWVWPRKPELAGHIWLYRFPLDGPLTPVHAPVLVNGRDILHQGPDTPDDALDLRQAYELPLFDVLMGQEGAVVNAALQRQAPEHPGSEAHSAP
jgi:hypothetical protein